MKTVDDIRLEHIEELRKGLDEAIATIERFRSTLRAGRVSVHKCPFSSPPLTAEDEAEILACEVGRLGGDSVEWFAAKYLDDPSAPPRDVARFCRALLGEVRILQRLEKAIRKFIPRPTDFGAGEPRRFIPETVAFDEEGAATVTLLRDRGEPKDSCPMCSFLRAYRCGACGKQY